jgi:hypothetical protein
MFRNPFALLASHAVLNAKQETTSNAKRPSGQKRPVDVIGNAVYVMRIATGEIDESFPADDGKNKAAQELGCMSGEARAEGMSASKRKEIAKKAAKARWSKARMSVAISG